MHCVRKIIFVYLLIVFALPVYGASALGPVAPEEVGAKKAVSSYIFTHYDLALIEEILAEQCERAKDGFPPSAVAHIEAIYKERVDSARATAARYAAAKAAADLSTPK